MDDIGIEFSDYLTQFSVVALRPQHAWSCQHLPESRRLLQRNVGSLKLLDHMSPLLQKPIFQLHNRFFPAPSGSIAIVHLQNTKLAGN
jgi:hypothetical protein